MHGQNARAITGTPSRNGTAKPLDPLQKAPYFNSQNPCTGFCGFRSDMHLLRIILDPKPSKPSVIGNDMHLLRSVRPQPGSNNIPVILVPSPS